MTLTFPLVWANPQDARYWLAWFVSLAYLFEITSLVVPFARVTPIFSGTEKWCTPSTLLSSNLEVFPFL